MIYTVASKITHIIIKLCVWVAIIIFSAMILLIAGNIIGRTFFNHPLTGTIELVELLILATVFLIVAYTEKEKGHVSVDILFKRLPYRIQKISYIVLNILNAVFFLALVVQGIRMTWAYIHPFRATDILNIPLAPFMFLIAFGSLVMILAILVNVAEPTKLNKQQNTESDRT